MNSATSTADLGELGQIALTVDQLDRSIAFYRDTLGVKLLFTAPPGLAFFSCGNVRLMLSRPETESAERFSAAIYFKVSDIHGAHRALSSRGISFEAEPHLVARMPDHELWMAFFRDPDRHLLALMCEKKNPSNT